MKTDIKSLLEFAGVDITKGKARELVEAADEFDFVGQAFAFNDAGDHIGTYDAQEAMATLKKAANITDVSSRSIDDLSSYLDGLPGGPIRPGELLDLRSFLTNLEGYDAQVFDIDHVPAGINLHKDTTMVIVVHG